jgi:hypothetical protein
LSTSNNNRELYGNKNQLKRLFFFFFFFFCLIWMRWPCAFLGNEIRVFFNICLELYNKNKNVDEIYHRLNDNILWYQHTWPTSWSNLPCLHLEGNLLFNGHSVTQKLITFFFHTYCKSYMWHSYHWLHLWLVLSLR